MRLKVYIKNIAYEVPETKEYIIFGSSDMTIQDLLDDLNYPISDLSDYYVLSGRIARNEFYFPFIVSRGKVHYNVRYAETKVIDFLATHKISDNMINIVTGYVQAGGPGLIPLEDMWEQLWNISKCAAPFVNTLAAICTLSGKSLKDIKEDICSLFIRKKTTPHAVMDLLETRQQWNSKELASYLDIPEENSKNLLKAFGYVYDRKRMQYVPGEDTEMIKEKIKNIQILNI